MILGFPASGGFIEREKQLLLAQLAFANLGQEFATLSFPKELIDIAEQAFR
jgi:hypothetical protein